MTTAPDRLWARPSDVRPGMWIAWPTPGGTAYVREDRWKPISSAPDKGPFLVAMQGPGVVQTAMRWKGKIVKSWDGAPFESSFVPTHWMSIPKAPA